MAFQILALSGGGYLGLFTAKVIADIEADIGAPIASRFDLIAGTSIGGILALGLAKEVPAATILEEFASRGTRIFSGRARPKTKFEIWRDVTSFIRKPKYDGLQLHSALEAILGTEVLGDLKHRVIIPTVNMTKGSIQLFKTPHHPDFRNDHRKPMVDVALATSAAPTFFPLASMDDALFVDGGVFANAPDLCALHEATHFLGCDAKDVSILSIGTTTSKFSLGHTTGRYFGSYEWLASGRLWSTISAAQQQLVDFLMRHQLGERYVRIDQEQSREQEADLALDVATAAATQTIRGMAAGAYQAASSQPTFRRLLAHRPDEPRFYYGAHA